MTDTALPPVVDAGTVEVRGFRDKNRKADGRRLTKDYLRYLAHHPDTAHRIAERLATKFVHDDPPASLVRRLAKVYLKNDTAIDVWFNIGGTAVAQAGGGNLRLPANGGYFESGSTTPAEAVSIIAASGTPAITAREF